MSYRTTADADVRVASGSHACLPTAHSTGKTSSGDDRDADKQDTDNDNRPSTAKLGLPPSRRSETLTDGPVVSLVLAPLNLAGTAPGDGIGPTS